MSVIPSTLYVAGQSEVDFSEKAKLKKVYAVIREHDADEKLMLGRHPQSHEWVLFLKPRANPFGLDAPYPVLGLGTETPDPERVKQLLVETDTRRNGTEILDSIHKNNNRIKFRLEEQSSEAAEILAEAQASYLHREGRAPFHQSLPKRDPKHRAHSTRKD